MTRRRIRLAATAVPLAWGVLAAVPPAFAEVPAGGPCGCSLQLGDTRPSELSGGTQLLESPHFVVSYATSGPDSLWRSDLPGILLEDLEYAYRVLSTDPRAAMHVPFGTYPVEGGPKKIIVRVEAITPGYSGRAFTQGPAPALEAPCRDSASGFILVSNTIEGTRLARRTAVHELMHLFQYAIDPSAGAWAHESTARWAEEFVYPGDRSIVESWPSFVHHTLSIWSLPSLVYSPHFWDFLDRNLGGAVPPEVWARACTLDWMEALRQTVVARGTDLDSMLHRYAVWNYYTGQRDDGAHYPPWDLLEIRPDASFVSYPVVAAALTAEYAQQTGSNYIFFSGRATRRDLRVRLDGSAAWIRHRIVSWIGTTGANTHHESAAIDPAAEEFVVPDWYRYDQVAVIVTLGESGPALGGEDLRYAISAGEEGESVVDLTWNGGEALLQSTNPSTGGAAIRYRSTGAARPTQVVIYDARGRLVKRLVDRVLPAGTYVESWDGTNAAGEWVGSGMYLLRLQHDGGTASRRFVLLH